MGAADTAAASGVAAAGTAAAGNAFATSAIGGTMVAVSFAKYLPQIRRIVRRRSVLGLAPAAYYGDALVFCTKACYHYRRGHPVSAWGELVVIFAQNVAIVGLIHKLRARAPGDLPRAVAVTRDLAGLGAFVFALSRVPNAALPLLSAFTAPLLIVSFTAQASRNARRRSTGQLSAGTVKLRLFGSTVRVITTITQLGGELPVLINHVIGLAGCLILLGQIWWFGRPGAAATVEPTPQLAELPTVSDVVGIGPAAAAAAVAVNTAAETTAPMEPDARRDPPEIALSFRCEPGA